MLKQTRRLSTETNNDLFVQQNIEQKFEATSLSFQLTDDERLKLQESEQQINDLESELQRLNDQHAEDSQQMAEELAKRVSEIRKLQRDMKDSQREIKEKNFMLKDLEGKLEELTQRIEINLAKQAEQQAIIAELSSNITRTTDDSTLAPNFTFNSEGSSIIEIQKMKEMIQKLEGELFMERQLSGKTTRSAGEVPTSTIWSSKNMSAAKRLAHSANTSTSSALEELEKMENRYDMQRALNAQLLMKLQSVIGNIQVCCRIRPCAENEENTKTVIEMLGESEIGFFDLRAKVWKSFIFDRVWGPEYTQEEVFMEVEPLCLSVVEGYNACIFAYGQTGSGKTFTMVGNGDLGPFGLGISFRTLNKIFELLELKSLQFTSKKPEVAHLMSKESGDEESESELGSNQFEYTIKVAMLEIYNEEIRDLLSPKENRVGSLEIRRETAESLAQIPGLTFENVTSLQHVLHIFMRGTQNRATSATNMNEHSSRSHSIFIIDVETLVNSVPQTNGRLYLVDLAGSERVGKSGVEGQALKEAQYINRSLSALGDVMESLDQKSSHIPFRNSKLTHLLQDALGGNSRTMMVVTVCPTTQNSEESYFTLQFATRVRHITINPAKKNANNKNLEENMKNLRQELKRVLREKEKTDKELKDMKTDFTSSRQKAATLLEARVKTVDDLKKGMETQILMLQKANEDLLDRLKEEKDYKEKTLKELQDAKKQAKILERNKETIEQNKNDKNEQLMKLVEEANSLKRQLLKCKQLHRDQTLNNELQRRTKLSSQNNNSSVTQQSRDTLKRPPLPVNPVMELNKSSTERNQSLSNSRSTSQTGGRKIVQNITQIQIKEQQRSTNQNIINPTEKKKFITRETIQYKENKNTLSGLDDPRLQLTRLRRQIKP